MVTSRAITIPDNPNERCGCGHLRAAHTAISRWVSGDCDLRHCQCPGFVQRDEDGFELEDKEGWSAYR